MRQTQEQERGRRDQAPRDEEEQDAEAWIPDTTTTSETDERAGEESTDSDPPEDPATPGVGFWTFV